MTANEGHGRQIQGEWENGPVAQTAQNECEGGYQARHFFSESKRRSPYGTEPYRPDSMPSCLLEFILDK